MKRTDDIPPDDTADPPLMTPARLAGQLLRLSTELGELAARVLGVSAYVDLASLETIATGIAADASALAKIRGGVLTGRVPITAGRDDQAGRDRYPLIERIESPPPAPNGTHPEPEKPARKPRADRRVKADPTPDDRWLCALHRNDTAEMAQLERDFPGQVPRSSYTPAAPTPPPAEPVEDNSPHVHTGACYRYGGPGMRPELICDRPEPPEPELDLADDDGPEESDAWRFVPVDQLDMSDKTKSDLIGAGLTTAGQLADWLNAQRPLGANPNKAVATRRTAVRDALDAVRNRTAVEAMIANPVRSLDEIPIRELGLPMADAMFLANVGFITTVGKLRRLMEEEGIPGIARLQGMTLERANNIGARMAGYLAQRGDIPPAASPAVPPKRGRGRPRKVVSA